MSSVGKRVILPLSFDGGPRFMTQLFQDAMNLVRRVGRPDLFITFTCNPAWPEIANELLINQKSSDKLDLYARVFRLKLKALLNDIVRKSVLGKATTCCYTIEFQKRSLPHCHMLFILDEEDKPRTPEDINRIASAEIPDPITHPLAYETVTNSMTHGPCGLLNPEAPCMKNGRCTKNYPFNFAEATTLMGEENENNNGKLTYRRRIMIDRVVLRNSGRTTIDNRRIVLHNLYLAAKYNAHINVEIYNKVNSIKYVYKYVYKGHDRAQVHVGNPAATEPPDEINNFLDARYVSASEACWRLLSFPMHTEFPACQRLDIHLPGDILIYYDANDHPLEVLYRDVHDTTLTAWFKYNASNPNDEEAMAIIYPNFCERYTFHKTSSGRYWAVRRSGFGGIIGRMYSVSPRDIEKYYLATLLLHVPGATVASSGILELE
ncbi:hypothetical protein G6F42_017939 [Rhizopus arrhizus]|nr:hypothetical protein G6F42_017939 [Rhizopus arrhizus]